MPAMSPWQDAAPVIATPVKGCLIVTLPADLSPEVFGQLRERTLNGLRGGGCHAVVFELSAVQIMDVEDFAELRALAATAQLLGARALLVGLSPGVVMHLVDSDVDTTGLEAVRDLEEALDRAERAQRAVQAQGAFPDHGVDAGFGPAAGFSDDDRDALGAFVDRGDRTLGPFAQGDEAHAGAANAPSTRPPGVSRLR
jgi:anti-anti-sigma regulatory factor